MHTLLQGLRWIDENIERVIIIISYVTMAGIIFVEVIRRMLFGLQAAWSVQIPICLFLFITWFSAAYNAKARSHLAFAGLRQKMTPSWQMACHVLDFACWITLGAFVIYYSTEQVIINKENFSMVLGTELMTWYFMVSTPIGWAFIVYRVTQNLCKDIQKYRQGIPLDEAGNFAGGGKA